MALNIVGFPNCLDPEILGEILRGGADKVKEAGAVLVGGHSVQDDEPKYGLSVSGFVHPDKIYRNYGCRPGDVLVLTKQIGSGIINTAVKAEMASEQAKTQAVIVMSSLNKKAKEAAEGFPVNACTDITGFGLLGHCAEMAEASGVTLEIQAKRVPYMLEAVDYAKMGLIPAGAYKNREHCESIVDAERVEEYVTDLMYDPQTSGGLLFSLPKCYADEFMNGLKRAKLDTKVSVIGRVLEKEEKLIRLLP